MISVMLQFKALQIFKRVSVVAELAELFFGDFPFGKHDP